MAKKKKVFNSEDEFEKWWEFWQASFKALDLTQREIAVRAWGASQNASQEFLLKKPKK